ncbi:MAG: metallophosphoesterase family protein [Nitrososphaeria archaeon]
MKIAAVGDIHAPLFLQPFRESLKHVLASKTDLTAFLLAGDIVDGGRFDQLDEIAALTKEIHVPIYACYGNNEYKEYEQLVSKKLPNVKFLDDSIVESAIDKKTYAIIGSRGVLEEPTFWQRKRWPNIIQVYETRAEKIAKMAATCTADFKILLIHYPPTLKAVEGENPRFKKQMGTSRLEHLIKMFNVVITAHVHKGKKTVIVDGVPVVNVSLPLRNRIVIVDIEEKKGLEKFF